MDRGRTVMDGEATETDTRRARGKRITNVLLGSIAIVAVIGLLVGAWWSTLNATPHMNIPMPEMRNPNARDYFIRAAAASVERNIAGTILGNMISATPPALTSVERSIPGTIVRRRSSGSSGNPIPSSAEQIALVRDNAVAFRILREGFAYPYQELPDRSSGPLYSHYAKYRSLARLLQLKAQTEAARGDWYGALNSAMDAIQFGQMMPHGAPLIGSLVSVAIQAIGGYGADSYIGHLNARQARASARRMERIITMHMPWSDVMQEEKWSSQAHMVEMFHDPKWRQGLEGEPSEETGSDGDSAVRGGQFDRLKGILKVYLINEHEVLYNYTRYMDQVIANARLPYGAHSPNPHVPDDPVNQIFALGGSLGRDKSVQMEAQNAQLCLRLAIRAYQMEHGAYPPDLKALVPDYLGNLPDDPYALQGSYGYTRDKVGYMLTGGAVPTKPPKTN